MALKDWKKSRLSGLSFVNLKISQIITIKYLKSNDYMRDLYKGKGNEDEYGLEIRHTGWPNTLIHREDFKTKSEALAYAKGYMRKH